MKWWLSSTSSIRQLNRSPVGLWPHRLSQTVLKVEPGAEPIGVVVAGCGTSAPAMEHLFSQAFGEPSYGRAATYQSAICELVTKTVSSLSMSRSSTLPKCKAR